MLPPVLPDVESVDHGAHKHKESSFETSLKQRTQEFEKQRLSSASASAYPDILGDAQGDFMSGDAAGSSGLPQPQADNRVVVIRKVQEPVHKGGHEDSRQSTIVLRGPQLGSGQSAGPSSILVHGSPDGVGRGEAVSNKIVIARSGMAQPDPYANMYYEPFVPGEKGKGHYLPVKGKWSEVVDDDAAWWYLAVGMFC